MRNLKSDFYCEIFHFLLWSIVFRERRVFCSLNVGWLVKGNLRINVVINGSGSFQNQIFFLCCSDWFDRKSCSIENCWQIETLVSWHWGLVTWQSESDLDNICNSCDVSLLTKTEIRETLHTISNFALLKHRLWTLLCCGGSRWEGNLTGTRLENCHRSQGSL